MEAPTASVMEPDLLLLAFSCHLCISCARLQSFGRKRLPNLGCCRVACSSVAVRSLSLVWLLCTILHISLSDGRFKFDSFSGSWPRQFGGSYCSNEAGTQRVAASKATAHRLQSPRSHREEGTFRSVLQNVAELFGYLFRLGALPLLRLSAPQELLAPPVAWSDIHRFRRRLTTCFM